MEAEPVQADTITINRKDRLRSPIRTRLPPTTIVPQPWAHAIMILLPWLLQRIRTIPTAVPIAPHPMDLQEATAHTMLREEAAAVAPALDLPAAVENLPALTAAVEAAILRRLGTIPRRPTLDFPTYPRHPITLLRSWAPRLLLGPASHCHRPIPSHLDLILPRWVAS